MFNLLMSADPAAWETGHWQLERSRFLEYTDPTLKLRFTSLDDTARTLLTTAPALFSYERFVDLPASLGRITNIHPGSDSLGIDFIRYHSLQIPAPGFFENRRRFGIADDFEMNRTHWALKSNDLFATGFFSSTSPPVSYSNRVFVVHGHDHIFKDEVGDEITKFGLEPVILHREANKGRTIIEKFEQSADVGFAVVLLTPDDAMFNGTSRARQNVILELGYFSGRLGRSRVCPLRKGNVELPSDIFGLVYTSVGNDGKWREELRRELTAAGYIPKPPPAWKLI